MSAARSCPHITGSRKRRGQRTTPFAQCGTRPHCIMTASARSCTTITGFVLPGAMLKCDLKPIIGSITRNLPQRSSIQASEYRPHDKWSFWCRGSSIFVPATGVRSLSPPYCPSPRPQNPPFRVSRPLSTKIHISNRSNSGTGTKSISRYQKNMNTWQKPQ